MDQQCALLTDPSKIVAYERPIVLIEHDDEYKNQYGAIRQRFVKEGFDLGLLCLEGIERLFVKWRDDPEYFILKGYKPFFVPRITTEDHDLYEIPADGTEFYKAVYKFILAAKRGNSVYRFLVSEKLFNHFDGLRDILFFKDDHKSKQTSLLFITLTYDTNRCDVKTAWENVGKEFHGFVNNLRHNFKNGIEFFRTWESTKHYYPHVHVIIGFKNHAFQVFTHKDKEGKKSFRISKKYNALISSYWHSFVDIKGVDNTKNAIAELTKYITKELCSDKGNKTNSMIWLFRKQSFAISKGFKGLVNGSFAEYEKVEDVKTTDLIKKEMCNCKSLIENWEFVGVIRGVSLGFRGDLWVITYEDPPPRIKNLIENESERWCEVRAGKQ